MECVGEVVERLDEVCCDGVERCQRVEGVRLRSRHSVGQGDKHGKKGVNRLRVGRCDQWREDRECEAVELSGLMVEMGDESGVGSY